MLTLVSCLALSSLLLITSTRADAGDGMKVKLSKGVIADFKFGNQVIPCSVDSGATLTLVATKGHAPQSLVDSGVPIYDPSASTTLKAVADADEYTCSDDYPCHMGIDSCTAGVDNILAQNFNFALADKLSDNYFASGQSCLAGFGRQAGDPSGWAARDKTFWYTAGAAWSTPYLWTSAMNPDGSGELGFGSIDSKYDGTIAWTAMDMTQSQWNLNFDGNYKIGAGQENTVSGFHAYIDSGDPNGALPPYILGPYFESFGGGKKDGDTVYDYWYPCEKYPPPDLSLRMIGGAYLVLHGKYLVTEPSDGQTGQCNGRVDSTPQSSWNIGSIVTSEKYIIYDTNGKRMGFADVQLGT